ncbi:hypothetical protein WJX84_011802 [Apatococcus fuscideae]|uniref:Uncharacterized protein n=1 Tax=Apatococcus fuscideae TaxID=2026836 RepID=A0AAW1RZ81_9CHLO
MFSSSLAAVLQVRKIGSLGELNPIPYAGILGQTSGQVIYGSVIKNWFVFWANAPGLVIGLWLTLSTIVHATPKVQNIMTACIMLIAIYFSTIAVVTTQLNAPQKTKTNIWGSAGGVALVAYYTAPLSTLIKVMRSRDSSSLHPPLCFMNFTNMCLWLSYGIAIKNPFIWVPETVGGTLSSTALLLLLIFPRRALRSTNAEAVAAEAEMGSMQVPAIAALPDDSNTICQPSMASTRGNGSSVSPALESRPSTPTVLGTVARGTLDVEFKSCTTYWRPSGTRRIARGPGSTKLFNSLLTNSGSMQDDDGILEGTQHPNSNGWPSIDGRHYRNWPNADCLHRQQCPITRVAADVALKHPAVLDWLLSQGMPEVENLCRTAIRRGELLGLQVLQTRGLPAQLDQPIDLSQPSEIPAAHGDLLVSSLSFGTYWQNKHRRPQHLELAAWLVEQQGTYTEEQQWELQMLAAEQGPLVLMQLAACSPQPRIASDPAMLSLAAAEGDMQLLRWRQQREQFVQLGDLPNALLKKTACSAGIDFSWTFSRCQLDESLNAR